MEATLRELVSVAFALLLVLLRFDAPRFGVAEHLEPGPHPARAIVRRRLAWFGLGLVLAVAIVLVHPERGAPLGLVPGEPGPLLGWSLLLVLAGIGQAAGVARLRTGAIVPRLGADLRWRVANAAGTALLDELAFRGVLLGALLLLGLPAALALLIVTLLSTVASRTTGGRGADPYAFLLALGIGLGAGVATVASGGIGAAIAGHLAARLATAILVPVPEPDDAPGLA